MKQKLIGLSQRYVTALRKHLKRGPSATLQPALGLGRQAVALGLETLELARIHERALATLESSLGKDGLDKRAEIFFSRGPHPDRGDASRRAAEQNGLEPAERDAESAHSWSWPPRTVSCNGASSGARAWKPPSRRSGEHYTKLLKESLQLQEGLRQLTHQLLASQEEERKKISLELQNEIAQTLLGINVRLLSLKQEARINTKGLKNEIASTQRLVVKSAQSVRRVAREFRNE